jgi:DNA polymerase-3 subunit chi
MARVRFYYNTPDPFAQACELVTRAYQQGRRIALKFAAETEARRFDQLLWTYASQSFVPHVALSSPLAPETPILLCAGADEVKWPHQDILFNLTHQLVPEAERFKIVIEIVGQQQNEIMPARQRWQHYKRNGHKLESFDSVSREAL